MADSTVTWKGAVPYDSWVGQSGRVGAHLVVDPHSVAAGFDIRPFHSSGAESAMQGAVPYFSTNDEYTEPVSNETEDVA